MRSSLSGRQHRAIGPAAAAGRPYGAMRPVTARPAAHTNGAAWRGSGRRLRLLHRHAADAGALGGSGVWQQGGSSGAGPEEQQGLRPVELEKPFARMNERDPYRLLGVSKDAGFDEIQDARNYLWEQYKWHEPSREAIESAFDYLLQKHYKRRHRFGFEPINIGRRGGVLAARRTSLLTRVRDLFDPTITTRTIVNEGAVFGAFALWVLFSADQSFPLAATFCYSVYSFQSKRVKRDPEGPFFGGNAIVGAIFATAAALAVGCGVMTLLTPPLASLLGQGTRQVGAFLVIAVIGVLNIYLK